MIEIAKAVLIDAKMIIMDEPTSSLGEKEVEQLMKTCRDLKARGIGIVFVSHKLEELFELCDRVTVIRDGEYIDTKPIDQWTNDSLITAMVGRSVTNQFPKEFGTKGDCFLKAEDLCIGGVLDHVSFEAYSGEILGFSGLVGAGRTETMRQNLYQRSGTDHQEPESRRSGRYCASDGGPEGAGTGSGSDDSDESHHVQFWLPQQWIVP